MDYPGNSDTKSNVRWLIFNHITNDKKGAHVYLSGPDGGDICAAIKFGIPNSRIFAAEIDRNAYQEARKKHPKANIFHGDVYNMVLQKGLVDISFLYLDLCGNINDNNIDLFARMLKYTRPKIWAITLSIGHESGRYAKLVQGIVAPSKREKEKNRVLCRHRILQETLWKNLGAKKTITMSAIRYINNKQPMMVLVGRMAAYTGERHIAPWVYWDIDKKGISPVDYENSYKNDIPITAALKATTPASFKNFIQSM